MSVQGIIDLLIIVFVPTGDTEFSERYPNICTEVRYSKHWLHPLLSPSGWRDGYAFRITGPFVWGIHQFPVDSPHNEWTSNAELCC